METWQSRRYFYIDTVDLSPEDHRVKFNGVLFPVAQVSVLWHRGSDDPGCGISIAPQGTKVLSCAELDEIPPWMESIIERSRPKGD